MSLSEKQTTPPYAEPIHLDEMKLHLRVDVTADDALITNEIRAAREWAEVFTGRQLVAAIWTRYLHRFPSAQCAQEDFEDQYSIRLLHPPVRSVLSITYVDTNGATQTLPTSVYDVDLNAEPCVIRLKWVQIWPPTREQPNAVTVKYVAGHAVPFTATVISDYLQTKTGDITGSCFAVNDPLRFWNSGGALPGGLATYTDFSVGTNTNGTLTARDSSGDPVDITSTGTGTQFIDEIPEPIRQGMRMIIGDLYMNREDSIEKVAAPVMKTAMRLLWPYRVMEMA